MHILIIARLIVAPRPTVPLIFNGSLNRHRPFLISCPIFLSSRENAPPGTRENTKNSDLNFDLKHFHDRNSILEFREIATNPSMLNRNLPFAHCFAMQTGARFSRCNFRSFWNDSNPWLSSRIDWI